MSINIHRHKQPRPKSSTGLQLCFVLRCSVVSISFMAVFAIPETAKNGPIPSLQSIHESTRNAENTSQLTNQHRAAIKTTNERQGFIVSSKQRKNPSTPANHHTEYDKLTNHRVHTESSTYPREDNSVSIRKNPTSQTQAQALPPYITASLESDKGMRKVLDVAEKRNEEEIVATESQTPQNVLSETQSSSTLKEGTTLRLQTVLPKDKVATRTKTTTYFPKQSERMKTVTTHFTAGVTNPLLTLTSPLAMVKETAETDQDLTSGSASELSHTVPARVLSRRRATFAPQTLNGHTVGSFKSPPTFTTPLPLVKEARGTIQASPHNSALHSSHTMPSSNVHGTITSPLTLEQASGVTSSWPVNQTPLLRNPQDGDPISASDSAGTTSLPEEHTTNNDVDYGDENTSGSSKEGDCENVFLVVPVALNGSILKAPDSELCVSRFVWIINVPKGMGIVVEFEQVQMIDSDSLKIYIPGDYLSSLRYFTKDDYESLAPLLRMDSTLGIVFKGSSWRYSLIRLKYTAHPIADIPPYTSTKHNVSVVTVESADTYYCDGFTNLPTAITCDGIRHCQHGEDEARCAYREQGCEDWFPYHNNCLKPIFMRRHSYLPGYSFPTMPLEAEVHCSSVYGATLASLQEPGGTEIATELVRKSGFLNAVVGIRKVKPLKRSLRHLYRFLWQWGGQGSPIAYGQQALQRIGVMEECAVLSVKADPFLEPLSCVLPRKTPQGLICMKPNPTRPTYRMSLSGVTFPNASEVLRHFPTKACPDGSVVQIFHRCQWWEQAEEDDGDDNHERSLPNLPLFQCRFGRAVHYSLLCDGKDDCVDRSDEIKCRRPQFDPLLTSSFICRNFQAIPYSRRCDGTSDCFDESDEESCVSCGHDLMCPGVGCVPKMYVAMQYFDGICPMVPLSSEMPLTFYGLPEKVNMDGNGMSRLDPLVCFNVSAEGFILGVPCDCDEGFYLCKGGHCIPTFLLNNGERDCPQGEDEGIPVNNMTCPGYYRCHGVGSCVHPIYVCDGVYHCPDKDDEMFCQLTCPRDCRCEGHAYMCSKMIDPLENLHVRYLDLSYASDVTLNKMHVMEYLSFLNLSSCGLDNVTLVNMPQFQILDLSFNRLADIASLILQNLPGLEYLDLSNNPFVKILGSTFTTILNQGQLSNLKSLLMTNVGLETIHDRALSPLVGLKYLDLRHNQLQKYGEGCLSGLRALEELHTDESKLCCGYFHPTLLRCHAPVDELSSCDDLLGEDFFRVFLWALSSLAIVGNAGVLVYRQFVGTKNTASASGVLVKNLCAADLLMGVYMFMIGIADAQLRGDYVAKETEWKSSAVCTAAGFLSFLSSEVSAFVVCLITLDRVLVICFPFRKRIHLTPHVTVIICSGVWIVGVILAGVPLLAGLEFYGQNGICVPLPITRQEFSGQSYAFGVFIVLNFVLFILIGVGQVFIYTAVHRASVAAGSQRRDRDLAIARRLFMIVLTDFCCWFPIGIMGLLAANGVPIPGKVNVWAAIFVLPLNSALNPFLYTLNGVLEKWRAKRAEETRTRMLRKLKTEIPKWQPASVSELVKICMLSKVLEKDVLRKLLALHTDSNVLALANEVSQEMGAELDYGELMDSVSKGVTQSTNLDGELMDSVSKGVTQSTNVDVQDDIQTE